MVKHPFAVTLIWSSGETLEHRVSRVLRSLRSPPAQWVLSDLDATGPLGGELTIRLNEISEVAISMDDLRRIFEENGQVIEMAADGQAQNVQERIRIIVRDGFSVDWLGFGDCNAVADLGPSHKVDCELFDWPDPAFGFGVDEDEKVVQ